MRVGPGDGRDAERRTGNRGQGQPGTSSLNRTLRRLLPRRLPLLLRSRLLPPRLLLQLNPIIICTDRTYPRIPHPLPLMTHRGPPRRRRPRHPPLRPRVPLKWQLSFSCSLEINSIRGSQRRAVIFLGRGPLCLCRSRRLAPAPGLFLPSRALSRSEAGGCPARAPIDSRTAHR